MCWSFFLEGEWPVQGSPGHCVCFSKSLCQSPEACVPWCMKLYTLTMKNMFFTPHMRRKEGRKRKETHTHTHTIYIYNTQKNTYKKLAVIRCGRQNIHQCNKNSIVCDTISIYNILNTGALVTWSLEIYTNIISHSCILHLQTGHLNRLLSRGHSGQKGWQQAIRRPASGGRVFERRELQEMHGILQANHPCWWPNWNLLLKLRMKL